MKYIQIIYWAFGLPAVLFHEVSHILMSIILWPLGVRLTGFDFTFSISKNGQVQHIACVYSKHHFKWTPLFTSLAPLFSFMLFYLLMLFHFNSMLIAVYAGLYLQSGFLPSKVDWDNALTVFGRGKPHTITDEELETKHDPNVCTASITRTE